MHGVSKVLSKLKKSMPYFTLGECTAYQITFFVIPKSARTQMETARYAKPEVPENGRVSCQTSEQHVREAKTARWMAAMPRFRHALSMDDSELGRAVHRRLCLGFFTAAKLLLDL